MADPGFLHMWAIDADVKSFFRIGVVGNGGSGKTLLLETLFSSQKVRLLFSDGYLLWLTVSPSPSFTILRDKLCSQIVMQTKVDLVQNMKKEDAKMWLNQRIQAKKFALFLDRRTGQTSTIRTGQTSTITMADLVQEKSWDLFVYHVFPYNNGNLPGNRDKMRARVACARCGGLPLAIKLVWRSMAGISDLHEWLLAIQSQEHEALYDRLWWSYDLLDKYHVNLQLGFLYLAVAFIEDQVIYVEILIWLWIGEGLVAKEGGSK